MEGKLYSQRLEEQQERPLYDVYQYQTLPNKLIVQLKYILKNAIGVMSPTTSFGIYGDRSSETDYYFKIIEKLMEEHGIETFHKDNRGVESQLDAIIQFFKENKSNVISLDLIELLFRTIETEISRKIAYFNNPSLGAKQINLTAGEAVSKLNQRFLENKFGFRYENGQLIRLDSEYIHSEATKPALNLLNNDTFKDAHNLFLEAHTLLVENNLKGCLVSANTAFEATLKIIMKEKGWEIPNPPNAARMIDDCVKNGLICISSD